MRKMTAIFTVFISIFSYQMMQAGANLANLSVTDLSTKLSQPDAQMDAAAAAALTASMAASLCNKVAGLNDKHQTPGDNWTQIQTKSQQEKQKLLILMQQDADNFQAYLHDRNDPAMQLKIIETPYAIMQEAYAVTQLAGRALKTTKTWYSTDLLTAIQLSHAAFISVGYIADADLSSLQNATVRAQYETKIANLRQQGNAYYTSLHPKL